MWRTRALALMTVGVLMPAAALAGTATMDQLWPNTNGRAWSYDQHYQVFGSIPQTIDNQIRLIFEGPTVAPNGIDAQYLRHDVVSGPTTPVALAGDIADPLLRNLWLSRPDLRAAIAAIPAGFQCPENAPPGAHAVLLNGEFAYRKTLGEIAAWRCNLADTRSWLWMESNLTLGSQFTLQLLPDIASDIFLHGTVAAVEDVDVPAGSYVDCVRIDYLVDYGTMICRDIDGNPTGSSRSETRGYVHYASDEGPIQSFEEYVPLAEVTGDCGPGTVGEVLTRVTVRLTSPSVPLLPTSWGRLKSIYR